MSPRETREIESYFELTLNEIEVLEEGLEPVPFGEFLVAQRALTRSQLYLALRAQDENPGIPLGEIAAYLGFVSYAEIDRLLAAWHAIPVVEVA